MGSRGPIPKTSDDRRRRNSSERDIVKLEVPREHRPRPAAREWGKLARAHYSDFKKSPQSRFYVASDWAMLWMLCNELDRYDKAERRNGQILTALLSGFSSLLATEGDRRRLQIELTSPQLEQSSSAGEEEKQAWVTRLVPKVS